MCTSNLVGEKSLTLWIASKAIAIRNRYRNRTGSSMRAHLAISCSTSQWTSRCLRRIISSVEVAWIRKVNRRPWDTSKRIRTQQSARVALEPEKLMKIKITPVNGHLQPLCKRQPNTHRPVPESPPISKTITVLMCLRLIPPCKTIEDHARPSSC